MKLPGFLTPVQAAQLLASLPSLSLRDKHELFELLEEREKRAKMTAAHDSVLEFAHYIYPGFKEGAHHRVLSRLFGDIIAGRKKRVIINIAPRMGKSEFSSYLLPAFYFGKFPDKKIIMGTHTASLSEDFGRRVRNLVVTDEYQAIFPATQVADDQKGSGKWSTSSGGQYYAVGVGGSIAGRGADLFIVDDPHALPLDTEVPTPFGWKTVEEIEVGDYVFGPDGAPTRVTAKSDVRRDRELFRLTTNDGEEVLCDGGHLWTYHSETSLANAHLLKTATARELAAWDRPNKPCLPRHAAVQYPPAALPIDPYVLGAWLGDGTASCGRMTSHPDDAPFMRAQFAAAGYVTTDLADAYSFGVQGLHVQLRELGLIDAKHIPEVYPQGSIEQRMALLQGLMDTDGTVTAAGQCSFQNTNVALVTGCRQLLHSLGVKAKLCSYFDARGRHATRKVDYRLNFKLKDAARMPRKAERTYTPTDKQRRSFVVTHAGVTADVQCITVERSDGLFLVGRGYVVTHNSEQDLKSGSKLPFETAWNWFQTGPLQRLMPNGAIVIIMTRWGRIDLTGMILTHQAKNPDADQWEVVELPAILHENTEGEKSLWPEQWPLDQLQSKRAGMDPRFWQAQYMQAPTSEVAAIIKREQWKIWEAEKPPKVDYIIQSWDTAHETKNTSNYSACTTWGVWFNEHDGDNAHVILLDAIRGRWGFPELKTRALAHYKEWEPDACLIEKKAAGAPLIQELRAMGIPISETSPSRAKLGASNDKIVRLNAVADMFASGRVWAPDTRWAREVIEEVASFPAGDYDDYTDTMTQALQRMRNGGFIRLDSDQKDEDTGYRRRRHEAYY